MRVLGISGSLRRDSYNTALLRHAGDLFEAEGAEFEIYHGLRDIPPYDEDYDTEDAPEAVSRIREAVRDADAVFFVTPEYNSSIPGALKNALDWISRPFATNPLRYKPVAVIGASTGMFGAVWAQAELRKILDAIGARVTEGEVAVGHAGERFDENGRLNEPNLEQEVHEVVVTLLDDAQSARVPRLRPPWRGGRVAVAATGADGMATELPPTRWPGPPTAYLPIAEHGIIGDLHTAAMVGSDGTIDWYCLDRFDGPSVFGALLDRARGGFYRIAPADLLARSKQLYLPDTNVLVTRFVSPQGVGEIQDFMPVGRGPQRLIRSVVGVRGALRFRLEVEPRFGYGLQEPGVTIEPTGAVFRAEGDAVAIGRSRSRQQAGEPEPSSSSRRGKG